MRGHLAFLSAVLLAACSQGSPEPFAEFGAKPDLPAPQSSLIPALNARQAVGWPQGAAPTAPAGFTVTRYAGDLAHPRWPLVLPNGDVLAHAYFDHALTERFLARGFPEPTARFLAAGYETIAAGYQDRKSEDFTSLTGDLPTIFQAFAEANADVWRRSSAAL